MYEDFLRRSIVNNCHKLIDKAKDNAVDFDDIIEQVGGVERANRGTKNQNPIGAYTGNFPSSYETNNLIKIIFNIYLLITI